MKRICFLLLSCLQCFCLRAGEPAGDNSSLMDSLEEYLHAIDRLPIPAACVEADFLISSVRDSVLRDSVAVRTYRHFRNSKVMGGENVAVYVYDKWFAPCRALFGDIDEFEQAGLFCFVNRQSLIGCKAPQLSMDDDGGDVLTFPFPNGRRAIIYFYSTDCPKCLLTSIQLRDFLNARNAGVDFFAVYTGDDSYAWQTYVRKNLGVTASNAAVYHLCGGDSDFVTSYGVTGTPRLFLVDGDGVIVGRHLDVKALSVLLR